jgi:adenylate cyclase
MTSTLGNRLETFIARLSRIDVLQAADGDSQSQQFLFSTLSLSFILAGALWGVAYLFLGEPIAASIPLGYAIVSLVSLVIFQRSHNYPFFRTSQFVLILFLPFLLMLVLGGFVNSSAVIIWSLLCPLGALVFSGPRSAVRWFLGFAGLVALSGLLQPLVHLGNNLSSTTVVIFFVLNIVTVSGIAFFMLHYFILRLNAEHAKSERLLLNVLPKEIARVLKDHDQTIAEHFAWASILFADMVGFTPLSAAMSPVEMVDLLNDVFTYFDSLAEKYGVEKIRTIGDSYMVAAGVPCPRADHAQALAHMALDMCAYVARLSETQKGLSFRIGINSGPVVAGVIGRKKFQYDLWGDAVNTASRMESHGTAGKIQISEATYDLLKDEFECEPRGTIPVKGKGEMATWYLLSNQKANGT